MVTDLLYGDSWTGFPVSDNIYSITTYGIKMIHMLQFHYLHSKEYQ